VVVGALVGALVGAFVGAGAALAGTGATGGFVGGKVGGWTGTGATGAAVGSGAATGASVSKPRSRMVVLGSFFLCCVDVPHPSAPVRRNNNVRGGAWFMSFQTRRAVTFHVPPTPPGRLPSISLVILVFPSLHS